MTSYVDIPGLIAIEQKFLNESSTLGDDEHQQQLLDLKDKLQNIANILHSNDGEGIITQQHQMRDIVNQEKERLEEKQKNVETAKTSQNRLISLNDNYSKKYSQYIKMIYVIVIGLAIIGVLIFLKVPSGITTIISIFVGSIMILYCLFIYYNIILRDNIYFDELNLSPAKAVITRTGGGANVNNIINNNDSSNNDAVAANSCTGSECCSVGTIWDASSQMCTTISPVVDSFTTLFESNVSNVSNVMKAWYPNEYELYTKI